MSFPLFLPQKKGGGGAPLDLPLNEVGMKSKRVILTIGYIPKVIPLDLFLDHSRPQKSQKCLEIANQVKQILVM